MKFTYVNNHNLGHNGVYGPLTEATRSSTYSWLEFVTTYILVLAMYGYMACGGFSGLYVGMSDRPKWNSLPEVNLDKILFHLSYS